jgi:hypothetical protein
MSGLPNALGWTVIIILSMVGWGRIVNLVLYRGSHRAWPSDAVTGIAFSTFVGGLLNLSAIISNVTIIIYLGAGILSLMGFVWRDRVLEPQPLRKLAKLASDPVSAGLFLFAIALAAIHSVAWMAVDNFNPDDDCLAYLVFPIKMLQTGSLGLDPFNERRLISGLGGSYFLNTFSLSTLGIEHIHIVDVSIGYVLLTALMFRLCAECGAASRMKIAAVCLLLIHSLAQIKLNVTSTVLPAAMLLSIFREIWTERSAFGPAWRNTVSLGVVVAGICSLKSTFIPICGCVLGACFFYQLYTSKRRIHLILHSIGFALIVFMLLLPWMISLHRSNEACLCPFIGKACSAASYVDVSSERLMGLLYNELFNAKMFLFFAIVALALSHNQRSISEKSHEPLAAETSRTWTVVLCAGILFALISGSVMFFGGVTARRYLFPLSLPSLAFFSILAASPRQAKESSLQSASLSPILSQAPAILVLLILCFFARLDSPLLAYTAKQYFRQFMRGIRGEPAFSYTETQRNIAAQASIPSGATLLVNVDMPFLMNFRRNTIFTVDWPGGASLPKDMPIEHDAAALAEYLIFRDIHYVAVSRGQLADADFKCPSIDGAIPFLYNSQVRSASFHASLRDLLRTETVLYDDGDLAVIELNQRLH